MRNKELMTYYNKMQTQLPQGKASEGIGKRDMKREYSLFFRKIFSLVKQTKELLEEERPWVNGYLWEQRKIQVAILTLSLNNTVLGAYYDDTALFMDCHFVNKYCDSTLWPFSKYNEFQERLDEILKLTTPQEIANNTRANILTLLDELGREKQENDENSILKIKLEYVKKLEASTVAGLMEKSLEEVSGNKILHELVASIRSLVSQELREIRSGYEQTLKEIQKKEREMAEAFVANERKYIHAVKLLNVYKQQHPLEFQRELATLRKQLNEEDNLTESSPVASDTPVSQLIAKHSFFASESTSSSGYREEDCDSNALLSSEIRLPKW